MYQAVLVNCINVQVCVGPILQGLYFGWLQSAMKEFIFDYDSY